MWGWAGSGERITVQFNKQTKKTKADKEGKWKIVLDAEKAGGPYTLTLKGENTVVVSDILVGEVWICSGQSNMEWRVNVSLDAEKEIAEADYPAIRHIKVNKTVSFAPQDDTDGGDWMVCSPKTAGYFSGVGYFFARELYKKLQVPIGLINASWGGTHVETWTSREAFENSPDYKEMIARMPSADLDAKARKLEEELINKLKSMNVTFPAKEVARWREPSYDVSKWNTLELPQVWERQGLRYMDGIVWLRRDVTISSLDAGKEALLELAMIDDSDECFVNGTNVGSTWGKWNEKRRYKIPAELLKEGENTIAIRVHDDGGNGGVYGSAEDMKLTPASGNIIPLAGKWFFNVEKFVSGTTVAQPNQYPTLLYNAMINPIIPYTMAGVIWYQGEANVGRAFAYRKSFPLMIKDWRAKWGQGDFPFYFVQLANYNATDGNSNKGSVWAELREAQTVTLTTVPNTGMAVTVDIGDGGNIHPRNKQDAGKRLAAVAFRQYYGYDNVYAGPTYKAMNVEGDKIRLSFDHVGSGLMVKDKYGYIKGFEICGSDRKFYFAKAWLDGNDVIVSASEVKEPVAVRYAWSDNPEDVNLYNKEEFPAVPFRTDTWKSITEGKEFSFE